MKNNCEIGIIMPYYNRQYQLNRTIESIAKQNYKNVCIAIVDDNSDDDIILPDYDLNIKIIKIDSNTKKWTNPEPAYNTGINYLLENTNSKIIISQNSECYHIGNIIDFAYKNTTKENYITFACYSINREYTFLDDLNIYSVINIKNNDRGVIADFDNGWYNHSRHRPVAYEFCSSIHVENIIKLNGYDERLSLGCGYGDNYLLHRIRLLGLDIKIIDNPFVVHQYHDVSIKNNKLNLVEKNRLLYNELIKTNQIIGTHLFTKNFYNENINNG